MRYRVPYVVLNRTFGHFRACGGGKRECQALWISAWRAPEKILEVEHPRHRAHAMAFDLDSAWLNSFWVQLANTERGIRVQVHTHPGKAFHSPVDDAFPVVHTPGFLSLVIPNFGLGPVGFENAYLTEIGVDGRWREVPCDTRLEIV